MTAQKVGRKYCLACVYIHWNCLVAHVGQTKAPVTWLSMCFFRLHFWTNRQSHTWQRQGFSPRWSIRWCFRLVFFTKLLPHRLHVSLASRSSSIRLSCSAAAWRCSSVVVAVMLWCWSNAKSSAVAASASSTRSYMSSSSSSRPRELAVRWKNVSVAESTGNLLLRELIVQ